MSNVNQARRTTAQVVFNGVDISVYVNSDLISLTYTDNEEDEADDLQIKVLDREKNWLQKWLDTLVSNAAIGSDSSLDGSGSSNGKSGSGSSGGGSSGGSGEKNYKVTATSGVNVRTNTTSKGKILGKLPYGTIVTVNKFSDGWAQIRYTGKTAWIKGENLKLVGSSGGGSGSTKKTSGGEKGGFNYDRNSDWSIGDEVIVTGPPQYSSYGLGEPGVPVTDWKGKISHLNLKPEIPYPIHVDWLGWFAENQVQRVNGEDKQPAEKSASRGLKISAAIVRKNWNADGNDEVLDCGQFELDNVTVDGPPNTVTIKATSLSYTNAIRQTEKSKSWENVTLSQILEFITKKSGKGYMFISSKNPKYTRVEQYRQSDIAFLSRLCHNAGCSLKVTSNIVVIFDQAEFEQNPEIKRIRFGEEYTKYRLTTNENDNYTSCRVYCTKLSGEVITATVYVEDYKEDDNNNQCLEIRQNVDSIAEAENLAYKMLRLHNKYEFEASFTFPGNPELTAGSVVVLEDFGAWNGRYVIKQAKHTLSHSGYSTQINLRKALLPSPADVPDETGDKLDYNIDDIALQVIRGDWDNGEARYDKLTAAGYDYYAVQNRVNEILGIR